MNIGMIAMSGVRACDAELLVLGLTLPGFVKHSRTIASLPSLGLLTLAGMTPPEHLVRYIEVADVSAMPQLPGPFDLVVISTFSAQSLEAYDLARRYLALGVPVVMGGLHVTSCPGEAPDIGATEAIGEGEIIWPLILQDAAAGELQPSYDARQIGEFDFAEAPMPAFEMLNIQRYNRLTVQTSRGCPWRCSFCASSILLTRRYKQKPPEKVLAEIDRIRLLWPRPFIEFADDNAFVNQAWWRDLLPELAKRRIKWFAETDVSIADDPELLTLMRRAGCAQVLIGFESPVESGLDGIELRRNWKWSQRARYADAIATIQSHGIRVNACFVVGLDGHGPGIFDAIYGFVEETAPFDVQITYPTPFPGTPLDRQLRRENRLTHDRQWNRCTLFDLNFTPRDMTADQLRRGFHDMTRRLYCEAFTDYRRRHFKAQLQACHQSLE